MDYEALEARIKATLEGFEDRLTTAYLFGSGGRREMTDASDIDLAILHVDAPPSTLDSPARRLEAALEKELRRPVEVIELEKASPDLVRHVVRDGRILLDNDAKARLAFEVRQLNLFFDLQPMLELYRRGGTEKR